MIDSNLSWKKQVEGLVKKVRRGIGILSKIRHYITKDILKSLYYTLIYPFLIYGLIAWGKLPTILLFNQFIFCKRRLFELSLFQVLIIILTLCLSY